MTELVQHFVNGLSLGSIYALIALGYTMVFGVLKLINFAHGEIYMVGAFTGYYTARVLHFGQESSIRSLLITLFVSMCTCGILGFLIEKLAYRPLRRSPRINVLITALGVSLFLQFSGQLFLGADPKFFPQLFVSSENWSLGEVKINPLQVMIFFIAVILMALLQFIVFKTRWGRAMRAVSFNHDLASLMGIPTDKIISATFILGSALAGAAGVLVGLAYPKIDPLMGVMPGLKAFVAAVLGGIGNITGAVVGAIVLGLAEEFLVGYWASSYRDALAFSILILILLFKPTGLFGTPGTEKV
jgi:branched-chain amino acid transport system permease protein